MRRQAFSTSAALLLGLLAAPAAAAQPAVAAQNGDKEGEEQPPLPADLAIPPAPVLSPEEALAAFEVPPGYRVELVAAEPLVEDPVAAFFGLDGRLWVAEMRGYMPDVDGTGEDAPVGTVAVLADTDGDGRMDERTVFLDGLVLPRALAPFEDGLLVIAPPDLFFARDTDGDGRADERTVIETGLAGIASPEHAVNGLMHTLDNWIQCANHDVRYRRIDGQWERQRTTGGGQWGLTRDDLGRIYYNTNSDPLRGDLISSHYAARNPNHGAIPGVNLRVAHDRTVWPARITPGVNRGYRAKTLRDDFTLASFTGACGPLIYRGDALPTGARGDAFICEPCGNLVKRYVMEEDEHGRPRAVNAYAGREFLTSTDERFRPVNLLNGPDGALYVVDMYRGIIQHRVFVTSFLRAQILERGLDEPLGLGRIWRVVHEDTRGRGGPPLEDASWTQLAELLAHPNGWWRDTVQRILVEEGGDSADARELVRAAALESPTPLGRAHALWSLEGMGALDAELLTAALRDPDPLVQHAAVRAGEAVLRRGGRAVDALVPAYLERARGADPRLARQILLSLGEGHGPRAAGALAALATGDCSTADARSAILSGLRGRELEFLALLRLLARCVAREGRSDRLEQLLELLAALPSDGWQREPLARGVLEGRPKGPRGKPTYLALARRPASLDLLADSQSELVDALLWPGREDVEIVQVRPLTAAEQARFDRGRALFTDTCSTCHQSSGLGDPGKAPPLRHSEWVLGSVDRLARIVIDGMDGPIQVGGRTWNGEMPAWSATDEDLAAVLTYVRREWGHGAEPVTPEEVAAVRAATRDRGRPWTVEELRQAVE